MDLKELTESEQARHPWETSRVVALKSILKGTIKSSMRALDLGCGDGYASRELFRGAGVSEITGVDTNLTEELAARFSKQGGGIEFLAKLPEGGRPYDLILLLDVIEHVPDDAAFLSGVVKERLTGGGRIMITVPAFNSLFSSHDNFLGHYRRYSLGELTALVKKAGCVPLASGYLYTTLLLPRFASACVEKLAKKPGKKPAGVGGWSHGALFTRVVEACLRADNALSLTANRLGIKLPGLTVWVLCEKQR